MGSKEKVIIVGGGHAGANVAFNLRRDGFKGDVTILTEENHLPYHRPPLSKDFFKAKIEKEKLSLKQPSFYAENNIFLQTGVRVEAIDRSNKTVEGSFGILDYSYLVLATGASPRVLNDADGENTFYLRTMDDVIHISSCLSVGSRTYA